MGSQDISSRFRETREAEWQRLDAILRLAERKSVRALSDEDLLALPALYRGALSSLSLARETSLDLELVTYLEGLSARAYFFVYGVRTTAGSKLGQFFREEWPDAVRSLWRETLASALFLFLGIAAAYLLVMSDPTWFDALVPQQLAGGRDYQASPDALRQTLYGEQGTTGLGTFAAFLFTHNSQISMMCFALGFAFGVPTAMLLVHNGSALGAMLALFHSRGLGFEFAGWLSIHGTTELLAIVLAGASGFRIGWAVVFPGHDTRLAAATRAGRTAAFVMVGVVIMLLCAGLLEGFGRQLVLGDLARYGIGGTMLLLWLAYFYIPRRRANG